MGALFVKMVSVELEDKFVKNIDLQITKTGIYSSRSEFLKDSIRKNYREMILQDPKLREIHEAFEPLRKLARERGTEIRMLSKEEKNKIAMEYAKEKGIKF